MTQAVFTGNDSPAPRNPRPPIFPLDEAHAALIEALSTEQPHHIRFQAGPADLESRAEHLERVLQATAAYVKVVLEDTSENCPVGEFDLDDLQAQLSDLTSDIVGTVCNTAHRMAEAA